MPPVLHIHGLFCHPGFGDEMRQCTLSLFVCPHAFVLGTNPFCSLTHPAGAQCLVLSVQVQGSGLNDQCLVTDAQCPELSAQGSVPAVRTKACAGGRGSGQRVFLLSGNRVRWGAC